MSRRTPVAAGIGTAAEELARDYEDVAADFAEFFPELRAHCETFLAAQRLDGSRRPSTFAKLGTGRGASNSAARAHSNLDRAADPRGSWRRGTTRCDGAPRAPPWLTLAPVVRNRHPASFNAIIVQRVRP